MAETGKASRGKDNHDAVQNQDWLAAGSGLTATLGWEKRTSGGNPKPAQLPKSLAQSARLIIPNYPNPAHQLKERC